MKFFYFLFLPFSSFLFFLSYFCPLLPIFFSSLCLFFLSSLSSLFLLILFFLQSFVLLLISSFHLRISTCFFIFVFSICCLFPPLSFASVLLPLSSFFFLSSSSLLSVLFLPSSLIPTDGKCADQYQRREWKEMVMCVCVCFFLFVCFFFFLGGGVLLECKTIWIPFFYFFFFGGGAENL